MANKKFTELTELTTVADSDILAIVDDPSGSPLSKKITVQNLHNGVTGAELAILDGATLTTTELNYVDGVTSAIQTQLDAKLPTNANINAQTGTTYTLLAADNGKVITLNNAAAITVTVPSGLGAGFNCVLIQKGAGTVSVSASGTTINNRQSHTDLAGQHASATLIADVANNFYFSGDTA
jgi:hypothetical protein